MNLLQHALFVLPLLLFAGFFSGTETALLSLSLAQREALRQASQSSADRLSNRVLWLLSNPRRLITTIILGNEITNILLSEVMTDLVEQLFHLLPQRLFAALQPSKDVVVAVAATLLTVPILVTFGELIPKTIGIKLNERWARIVAGPTFVLTWVLAIPRWIISGIASAVLFLLGQRARHSETPQVLSEKQFRTLVDLGSAEGEIQRTEAQLIHNVLDFGDLTVREVMTPAGRVFSLPYDLPLGRAAEAVTRQRYSRVPVYRGRKDNIVGILFAKDMVGVSIGTSGRSKLSDLLHPPLFVPRRAKAERVFREFQRRKTHMALVVDEYGRLAGVVTMEDLLDWLFGDIADAAVLASQNSLPGSARPSLPHAAASDAAAAEAGPDDRGADDRGADAPGPVSDPQLGRSFASTGAPAGEQRGEQTGEVPPVPVHTLAERTGEVAAVRIGSKLESSGLHATGLDASGEVAPVRLPPAGSAKTEDPS